MHPAWRKSFEAFYEDVGPKPKGEGRYCLDRIDNDQGYVRGNVRWVSITESNKNKSPIHRARR